MKLDRMMLLLCAVLTFLLAMTACSAEFSVSELIDIGELKKIGAELYSCGGVETMTVANEEMDGFFAWLSDLKIRTVEFDQGETPADVEGGMCYDFDLNDGEQTFSCYFSQQEAYLRFEERWYEILNWSDPFEQGTLALDPA